MKKGLKIYFGFLRQPGRLGWCWSGDYVCGVICLIRQCYRIFGGATYKVSNLEGFTKEVWICPVTLFVLGKYPKRIYVSNSQK